MQQPPPPIQPEDLAANLAAALPQDQRVAAEALAAILAALADRRLSESAAAERIAQAPALAQLLRSLAGRQVSGGGASIAFGTGNRLGTVTIGSMVGGDQITLNVTMADTALSRRRFLLIGGGLLLVAALVIASIVLVNTSNQRQLQQTNQAIAADALTNIANLDAQLLLIDTARATFSAPQSAPSQRRQQGLAALANLKQSLAMRPLNLAQGAQLAQSLIDGGADPLAVRMFYQSLQAAQSHTDSLLTTLELLANQRPDDPVAIGYYERLADLDWRRVQHSAAFAYMNGLLVLQDVQASPATVEAQLGLLQQLAPRTLLTEDAIVARLAALEQEQRGLIEERRALIAESGELLIADLQINPDDTWDVVVGKAIALRKGGAIEAAVAAFARYGELFAASDPTAAQYARTAQAFTRQSLDLGLEGGMYLFQVDPGSNGADAGFLVGDIIVAIDQAPVLSAADFEIAAGMLPAGAPVAVAILRLGADGAFARLTITVPQPPIGVGAMPV